MTCLVFAITLADNSYGFSGESLLNDLQTLSLNGSTTELSICLSVCLSLSICLQFPFLIFVKIDKRLISAKIDLAILIFKYYFNSDIFYQCKCQICVLIFDQFSIKFRIF